MKWTKNKGGDGWFVAEGPFVAKVLPKGDGRWVWDVLADGNTNALASGVRPSLGGAKTAVELYFKRSGRV